MSNSFLHALCATALLVSTLGAGEAPKAPVRASVDQLSLKPGDPEAQKIFTWAGTASGSTSNEFQESTQLPSETTVDLNERPVVTGATGGCVPQISKVKGTFTSEGYIIILGACLGTSGTVIVSGFPSGDPHVSNQSWTPTAITVKLPKITGVPNLTMHLAVQTSSYLSKPFDVKYVAALGAPKPLPAKYIANDVCTMAGVCSTAPHPPVGAHWNYMEQLGTDVWTLHVPQPFHLHAIRLVHLTSGTMNASTLQSGDGTTTFKVTWKEKQNGQVTGQVTHYVKHCADASIFGGASFCSTSATGQSSIEVPTYNAAYRIDAEVVGPAGMSLADAS